MKKNEIIDLCPGHEVAAGVWMERRYVLKTGFSWFALATIFSASSIRRAYGKEIKLDSFDAFVDIAETLTAKLLQSEHRHESAYLLELAAHTAGIQDVPEATFGEPFRNIMYTALSHRRNSVVMIQWKMDPGSTYPAHNHPNYAGLTFGLEGQCRIRNFQPTAKLPSTKSSARFQLRETQNHVLYPGRVSSMMSTSRDNVHKIHTDENSVRGLDITALLGEHIGFGFIEIDENSRDDTGVYQATWGDRMGGY